jgi:hypothetical protein
MGGGTELEKNKKVSYQNNRNGDVKGQNQERRKEELRGE